MIVAPIVSLRVYAFKGADKFSAFPAYRVLCVPLTDHSVALHLLMAGVAAPERQGDGP